MMSDKFQDYVKINGTGATFLGISQESIGNYSICLPSLEEQLCIANYLDIESAKIDQAVTIKKKQIELLKERRQILIQNAVTRGLDPQAPMRDSGVEWVGEIPAHWGVKRAKYLFNEVDERSVDGKEELLSVSHMTGVTPRSERMSPCSWQRTIQAQKPARKMTLYSTLCGHGWGHWGCPTDWGL